MTESELTDQSLTEIATAIAARKVSAVEVARACLERIERYDVNLNAVAAIDGNAVMAAATQADTDLEAGRVRGPLHGVPLAHKDLFYRSGQLSEWGSKMMAGFRPDHTATVLQRLDAAGALDIARLNMVEFALGATGHNKDVATPRNPWNPDYTLPAAPQAVPVRLSRRASFTARSAPTRADRSGFRLTVAALLASNRHMAGSAATAPCRSPSRSTMLVR